MDSDEDGTYGYDIPDTGPGFRLSAMQTHNDDADDTSDEEDKPKTINSSDDEDNNNFSYGAYGKRKHGISEKERNVYGVFYESDSDREGYSNKKRKARHFDGGKNRQAGLAFVKASSGGKGGGSKPTPAWLKESDAKPAAAEKPAVKTDAMLEEDSDDALDEEDMKLLNDSEARFHELLRAAGATKRPVSFSMFQKKQPSRKDVSSEANSGLGTGSTVAQEKDDKSTGLGFLSSTSNETKISEPIIEVTPPFDNYNPMAGLGSTPGLGSTNQSTQQQPPPPSMGLGSSYPSLSETLMGISNNNTKKRDPSLGKWEKHTKGIGMKLLSKMGYEGSGGLGAKRRRKAVADKAAEDTSKEDKPGQDVGNTSGLGFNSHPPTTTNVEEGQIKRGISRPVEVVVRPTGLGLGYGSFKEASQLKVNKQIEAEVRGLDVKTLDEESKKETKDGVLEGVPKSLLPSTQSLLSKGSHRWRRGAKGKKKTPKIVHYQDIIGPSENESKVIDMRGPGANQATPNVSTTVPLGEELLHNVTLLLNTHENQLRTASYMVNTTQKKIESLEAEGEEMKQRRLEIQGRIDKMKLAVQVVDEAEELNAKLLSVTKGKQMSPVEKLDFVMQSIQKMQTKLDGNFSPEERKSLKIDTTFIPSIVKPPFDILLSSLDPFQVDDKWMSHLSSGIKASSGTQAGIRRIIFLNCITPWIEKALTSSKWDPVTDSESGLLLYERLLTSVQASFPESDSEETWEEIEILKESLNEELILKVIYPKIQRFVTHLKPKLDRDGNVINPMHLWILPWLPHFGRDILGTILDEVRRKLKNTLSLIGKSEHSGLDYFTLCMRALEPWKKLFEGKILHALTSDAVTPRFGRALSRMNISFAASKQDWSTISILFQYFDHGLMSVDDFVSLIEGEVLPAWVNTLYYELKKKAHQTIHDAKNYYIAWKTQLMSTTSQGNISKSSLVLRSESMTCRYFFGGLAMIEAALESNDDVLDSLHPPNPADCNYRITLMHRAKAAAVAARGEEGAVANGSVRTTPIVHQGANKSASFQEVVAEFAKQHDIEFYPKTGSNSIKDGKPVFMLGNHPVYFDNNVIFALRGSSWQPISLEHLAQSC